MQKAALVVVLVAYFGNEGDGVLCIERLVVTAVKVIALVRS